jgi:hypothetical protein
MNHQSGMSLTEALISLFIASLISLVLVQLYIMSKRQYIHAEKLLEIRFERQWVSDLLSDSVRRAGFTPCVSIEHLEISDRRSLVSKISAINIEYSPRPLLQVNRMSEVFSTVTDFQSSSTLIASPEGSFKEERPVLIADCYHAEIQQILNVNSIKRGFVLSLRKPLLYSYEPPVYVGEWLEEKWFIKPNIKKKKSLHYQLFQTEELTPWINSLGIKKERIRGKQFIELLLGGENDEQIPLIIAVRGS